jgi:cobalt-zinc-cadmium efflux system outer membrane protein
MKANKRPKKRLALAGIILTATTAVALGQESGLTLEQAVAIALARNPDVLAARAQVDAARGRTLQLGARPVPDLALRAEGIPLPALRKEGDETELSLGIERVFELPGRRSLRVEIGRTGEALAQAEADRVGLIVAGRVKKAYWKAVFARRSAATLEKSAEIVDALLANIQLKYQSGAAAYADLLRARVEKARLRNQILETRKESEGARVELDLLLGRPDGERLPLLTDMSFVPLTKNLPSLQAEARTTRPSLKIAALRKDRAAAAVKLAALVRRPDFLAGFFLPSLRPNGWGVSFGLTLPFLQPSLTRGAAMEAAAEEELGRLAAEATDRMIAAALERAYAAAKAAEEQVLVFEQKLLREMEDELKISLDYYRYGKIESFNLLDLARTSIIAEVERLRALYLYLVALADLEVAGEEFV